MICAACQIVILKDKGEDFLKCSQCPDTYHASCLNLSREENKLLRQRGNKLQCPACKIKTKVLRTDKTPVRCAPQPKLPRPEPGEPPKTPASIATTPESMIPPSNASPNNLSMQQMQELYAQMLRDLGSFTAALNNTTADITDFRKELSDVKVQLKEVEAYKAEVIQLRSENVELRRELAASEQRHNLKDIEVTGITEDRNENLMQIVSVLSTKLGVELDLRDVDDVRRVGSRATQTPASSQQRLQPRPRPVIITFTRRAPRDSLLKAARVRRGLTTEMVNVTGNPRPIYVNEHLTKANRILFSKARAVKSELNFKYAWTSNGNIFLRRSDTSSVLWVNSESILNKLVNQNKGSVPESGPKPSF